MTFHHSDDPAVRWSAQLQGLHGRRRETVVKALRNSVASGHPAREDGVRILVAYAQGQISARQYVAQVLESLGFWPAAYTPPPPAAREPWRQSPDTGAFIERRSVPRPPSTTAAGLLEFGESRRQSVGEPERGRSNTITETRRTNRHEAVQAYVSGQIPIEEFLRISGN